MRTSSLCRLSVIVSHVTSVYNLQTWVTTVDSVTKIPSCYVSVCL